MSSVEAKDFDGQSQGESSTPNPVEEFKQFAGTVDLKKIYFLSQVSVPERYQIVGFNPHGSIIKQCYGVIPGESGFKFALLDTLKVSGSSRGRTAISLAHLASSLTGERGVDHAHINMQFPVGELDQDSVQSIQANMTRGNKLLKIRYRSDGLLQSMNFKDNSKDEIDNEIHITNDFGSGGEDKVVDWVTQRLLDGKITARGSLLDKNIAVLEPQNAGTVKMTYYARGNKSDVITFQLKIDMVDVADALALPSNLKTFNPLSLTEQQDFAWRRADPYAAFNMRWSAANISGESNSNDLTPEQLKSLVEQTNRALRNARFRKGDLSSRYRFMDNLGDIR